MSVGHLNVSWVFCLFLIFFLLLSCKSSLCILDISLISEALFANNFLIQLVVSLSC